MHWRFARPLWAVLLGCTTFGGTLQAQTTPSLREAVEAAWTLGPQARAQASRHAELQARSRAAASHHRLPIREAETAKAHRG